VLGHEGAGIVEQVGTGVTRVKPGDAILVNWLPACGSCVYCLDGRPFLCERLAETTFKGLLPAGTSRLATSDGLRLKHYLSAATMAERAVIGEESAVAIPADMPFEVAAIIGCAVATGVGAVINTARVRPGSSAAVFGCGGVGSAQSWVKTRRLPPYRRGRPSGRQAGIRAGAGCNGHGQCAAGRCRGCAAGHQRPRACVCVRQRRRGGDDLSGAARGSTRRDSRRDGASRRQDRRADPGGHADLSEQAPIGSFAGSIRPHIDLPWLVEAYRSGLLPVDRLITKCYRLDEVGRAFDDMESVGSGVRRSCSITEARRSRLKTR
jgi:S-(hydroxymethyl)glutathione dehydrogenase/alcohol dehydrogenase